MNATSSPTNATATPTSATGPPAIPSSAVGATKRQQGTSEAAPKTVVAEVVTFEWRLRLWHRCPTCTTGLRAIQVAATPGVAPPGTPGCRGQAAVSAAGPNDYEVARLWSKT